MNDDVSLLIKIMIDIEILVNYSSSVQLCIHPSLSDDLQDLQGIWKIFRMCHSKALYYRFLD